MDQESRHTSASFQAEGIVLARAVAMPQGIQAHLVIFGRIQFLSEEWALGFISHCLLAGVYPRSHATWSSPTWQLASSKHASQSNRQKPQSSET